ncbi:NAD-dependent 4,6-dehydratase LegB [Thermodesulfobacteriota bacterium]
MGKILVTGAGGFIGSHLAELLVAKGYNVRAFLRYNSKNRWGFLERSDHLKEIEIIMGDVRDYDSVFSVMQGCEAVFHLAALIGIPYSYVSPLAYIRTNVEGTYNILQAAKELELDNVLITSTSETYGSAQYVPIDEKHPTVGQSPYAATKIAADQLALSYYRSFGLPVKVVRPFNTFGPRQSARAIIPTVIAQILSGRSEIMLGNLNPTRDLTYVSDTVRGFVAIARSEELIGESVNIGAGKEISIKNLAEFIAHLMGKQVRFIEDSERVRPKNSEVERLVCDNSKIAENTGWEPRIDLHTGLRKTIEWIERQSLDYKDSIYNI